MSLNYTEFTIPGKTEKNLKDRWKNIKTARRRQNAINAEKLTSGTDAKNLTYYKYEDAMHFIDDVDLTDKK